MVMQTIEVQTGRYREGKAVHGWFYGLRLHGLIRSSSGLLTLGVARLEADCPLLNDP